MRLTCRQCATSVLLFVATTVAFAQTQSNVAVPRLVRFTGAVHRADPSISSPSTESVTLAVYREQTGGTPLWQEVQNVSVDAEGRYSLLMGATVNEGMPVDLFNAGEPRWLGVLFNRAGETEQSRVLLVSVPYALKAADAETLGGRPASAYLLAEGSVGSPTTTNATNSSTPAAAAPAATPATTTAVKPRVSSGSPNFIGKFTNATDLVNSAAYEIGGNIGISTVNPLIALDVRTGSLPQMGIAGTTDYLTFFASDQFGPAIYWDPAKDMRFGKGGASLYNPFGFVEYMRIQSSTGNVGLGTLAPGSKLDVAGDINFTGKINYQGGSLLRLPNANGNLSLGLGALINPTGTGNTAMGTQALSSDTTGSGNTAIGASDIGFLGALGANTSGNNNTAIGLMALARNTSGDQNAAIGADALQMNTTGANNTATGAFALQSNTTGGANTADGNGALRANTLGQFNTASGVSVLMGNTSGSSNSGVGAQSLSQNTVGGFNTAVGFQALQDNTSGNNNIAIGNGAGSGVSGVNSNNIHIGNTGLFGDSNTIRLGNTTAGPTAQTAFFSAGIRGVTTGNNDAIPVMIDSLGQLGTVSSSRRFKEDIADMGDASLDLMRLRPVTYRYKQPFADGSKPVQYGLIAEEVAEVYPDLVAHSADGKIETVKYQVLDTMLLNEVQRLQSESSSQKELIRKLEERLSKLENKQ